MVRPILTLPHPTLRKKSIPVQNSQTPDIQQLIRDLKDSCVAAQGIGLAAPQIGVLQRVIVIRYPDDTPYALVNPEITWASSSKSALEEGCLSIPDLIVSVYRPRKVKFSALDEKGDKLERTANDLLAKIIQHEIDHLNGVLISDYEASLKGKI